MKSQICLTLSAAIAAAMRIFGGLFADATCYLGVVPTYVGGFMAFGWGTDDLALRSVALATLQERFAAANLETRYYTPELHGASFVLPRFIGDIVTAGRGRSPR